MSLKSAGGKAGWRRRWYKLSPAASNTPATNASLSLIIEASPSGASLSGARRNASAK
jgi:hypothetical protein